MDDKMYKDAWLKKLQHHQYFPQPSTQTLGNDN